MLELESIFLDFKRNPGNTYVEATIVDVGELKDGSKVSMGSQMARYNFQGNDPSKWKSDAKKIVLEELNKDERFSGKDIR